MDRQATKAAIFFVAVLSITLYVPPLTGMAVTTSAYTPLKKYSMIATNSRPTGANCTGQIQIRS
jgi:hypothetical protein